MNVRHVSSTCLLAVLLSAPVIESHAQLEEITVTARRYAESLQDIPQSVSAMTGEYMESQNISRVTDILSYSPGGNFTRFNKMQDEYSIRGVSSQTEGASGDPSVVTVIDNVVVTKDFMKNPAFFDMERVEILRGPQGTSFGRNATSGLIHLITARPEHEFSGGITVDAGNYDTYGIEAHVTGGITDNLAGRLAVNFDSYDGYTENIDAGVNSFGDADTIFGQGLGGEENIAVRGSLLWDATEDLQFYFKAEYNEDNDTNPAPRKGLDCTVPYQDATAGPPSPGFVEYPVFTDSCDEWETSISDPTYLGDFFLDREMLNITGEMVWNVNDDLTFTTVLGYMEGESDYLIDTHGGPNNSNFQSTQNDADMFSAEFRLDNHASGNRLRWLAGFYYMQDEHARDDQNIFFVDNSVGDPQHPSGFRPETRDVKEGTNETESFGVFGELSYDISDKLNASFGLRYSDDSKDYTIAHYGWGWGGPIDTLTGGNPGDTCVFAPGGPPTFGIRFCGSPAAPVGFTTPVATSNSWDNVSFKGSLQYQHSDELMFYGLVSQGYKTGGFQPEPLSRPDASVPFDEETVTNYEVGFKAEVGGSLRFNMAAFYTDYEDLQIFFFQPNATGNSRQVVDNASNVEIYGIEMDAVWQVNERLSLSGTFSYHDAELVDSAIDTDGDGIDDPLDGTRPDNTPKHTATAAVEYDIPLDGGSMVTLRGDYRATSNIFDDIGENPLREHDSYGVFGLRGTWRSADQNLSVSLWSRNIFEKAYTVNVGPFQPNNRQLNFAYGAPRTIGGTVSYDF